MMSFLDKKLENIAVPMRIVNLIAAINQYKGKQDLYRQQSPQILESLKNVAIIQSTKASNSIEGIHATDKRLKEIMEKNSEPKNRSESEIAGYRDVLSTIHASFDSIPISSNIILQLHRDLYKFITGHAGLWKNSDNVIEEVSNDGSISIRFKPVPAYRTDNAMCDLCEMLNSSMNNEKIDKLILISAFILDFLCIHPFNDGNGRMARLLTLLLLYKFGYEVGRFISLEKIIEESKESYYESLKKSSDEWHEGTHDIFAWTEYLLGTILFAYKEFADRVGIVESRKGNKSERVDDTIKHFIGEFTKEDVRNRCPDICLSTINRALEKLKIEGKILPMGKGRNAKWRKTFD